MPLNNFGCVARGGIAGNLYRGAQPDEHGFTVLEALHIGVVCKLSRDDEFPNKSEVAMLDGITVMLNDNFSFLKPNRTYVVALVEELQDALDAGHDVFVHCMHGRDRTGLLMGAYQILKLKMPIDRVLAEFNKFGMTPIASLADFHIRELLTQLAAEHAV